MSELSLYKTMKEKNSSEPAIILISKQKITNPCLKYCMKFDDENFDLRLIEAQMKVRRMKPRALKFSAIDRTYTSGARRANDETLKILANIMGLTMKSTKIEIDCENCYQVTDKGLAYVCKSIRRFTALRNLNLNLGGWSRIQETGISSFAQCLSRFIRLQSLTLNFRRPNSSLDSPAITNKPIQRLSLKLKNFMNLQSFYLDFSLQKKITDVGIQSLMNSMKKIISLQSMTLLFGECKEISDAGLVDLSKCLGKLIRLKSLKLEFYRCPYIGDRGIENLSESMEKLKELQTSCGVIGVEKSVIVEYRG